MHPPKVARFDVTAGINIDTKGCPRPVQEYRVTPFGLYMSRPVVGRPNATWIESWLLPELGICVSNWCWRPGHERDQDYYLDIAEIVPGDPADGQVWRLTDLYLDVVVRTGRDARVIDVDEFVAAVAAGLLDRERAEYAMHRTHAVVDGLAAHGHDLDAWLTGFGITLTWGPTRQAANA